MIAGIFDAIKDAFLAGVQAVIDAIGGALNALVSAWPIGMPSLPAMPDELVTAFAWIIWTFPLTAVALGTVFASLITIWIAIVVVGPVLRWTKVID